MESNAQRLIFRILDMYYNEDLTQETIANKFNISRSTVSRMLTKAKKDGYINININYPTTNYFELEKRLEKKFNLKEAIIVNVQQEDFTNMVVPRIAAEYICRIIQDGMKISVSWGTTLKETLDYMEDFMNISKKTPKDLKVIPLLGSPDVNLNPIKQLSLSNILVKNMGRILNAESFYLSAPMIVNNKITKGFIESEKQIAYIIEHGKSSDAAIVSLGALDEESSPLLAGLITSSEQKKLKELNVYGDVMGRYYDADGNFIKSEFNERIIGIKINDYMKIPTRIGIVYGRKKVKAIAAALKGGIINVIVTDSITANMVLEELNINDC